MSLFKLQCKIGDSFIKLGRFIHPEARKIDKLSKVKKIYKKNRKNLK
ncbi:MAG: hypothetical protein ACTSWG_10530 [Candidatus Helarchaeota archaeon]